MFELFSSYPARDFILAGDFNAKCGELQDIIIDDTVDFIFEYGAVYDTDAFQITQVSKDKTCNNFGFSLIDMCRLSGVHIINGRLLDDQSGETTRVAK